MNNSILLRKAYLVQNTLYLIDSLVWIGIKIVPGVIILKILKLRPWKIFKIILMRPNLYEIALRLKEGIKKFIYQKKKFSSCLSKVTTSRIVLDIFGIENTIKIGINKYSNGDKIPHAVISIKSYKELVFSDSEVFYLGPLDNVLLTI